MRSFGVCFSMASMTISRQNEDSEVRFALAAAAIMPFSSGVTRSFTKIGLCFGCLMRLRYRLVGAVSTLAFVVCMVPLWYQSGPKCKYAKSLQTLSIGNGVNFSNFSHHDIWGSFAFALTRPSLANVSKQLVFHRAANTIRHR